MATASRKNYDQIAASRITRPSQMSSRPPRILVYGRNKKGKTRFCTTPGQGKVLIIDPEAGTSRMTKLDPHVWPVEKWEDIDEVYKFLKGGNHSYEWVALDPMTRIHNMALRWVRNAAEERSLDTKPGLVDKRHYGQAGELTKDLIWNFHNLPLGLILTAQERQMDAGGSGDEDEEAEESASMFVPDLPKGARAAINSVVDVIGRIYTVKTDVKVRDAATKKVVEKTMVQRRLWLEPHPSYDTGYRSDFVLPMYIKNPTVPQLVKLMMEGKTNG